MKIVICEDKTEDRNLLHSCVKLFLIRNNCTAEIVLYDSGEALLADADTLNSGNVKIAFLDIFLSGINGIDIAKKIREIDEEMVIIFTTVSRDYGLDGYLVGALQYILKPLDYNKVEDILSKCMRFFVDFFQTIEVISGGKSILVLLKDITHIEVSGHDCLFFTTSKTIKSRRSLDDIEKELCNVSFVRTQRSFIVNMRYIAKKTGEAFLLTNGTAVPISRKYKKAVTRAYEDFIFALTRSVN